MALPRVLCRARLLLNNDFSVVSKYPSVVNSVSINKSVQIGTIRYFRTHYSAGVVLSNNKNEIDLDLPSSSSSSDSESTDSDSDSEDDVSVHYHKGLPQITVPLPSRRERCRFTLKPVTNTVGDFLEMLRKEDRGIDRAVCQTKGEGTRIAASNTIETLLDDDFRLVINDTSYNVSTPKQERVTGEEIERLNDVKNLVNQLYEAMHIDEHQFTKEKELMAQLETLQQELMPLEQKKLELEMVAHRRANFLAWAGLGLMSVQFGIMARLTWWEYSWDIMEPVTYFVTYGTAMACYAYYVLTRTEYVLQDVRDRQHLLIIHKKAPKLGLDLNQYNMLKQEVVRIQYSLKKLRNPLKLKIPPRPIARSAPVVEAVPETPTTAQPEATEVPKGVGIPKVTAVLSELLKNVTVLKDKVVPSKDPAASKRVEKSSVASDIPKSDKGVPKK